MALLIKLRSLNSILGYSKRAFTSHAQMLPRSITANNRQNNLNLHHHGVQQSGSFFINTFRFNSIDSRSRVMDGEPLEGTISKDTTQPADECTLGSLVPQEKSGQSKNSVTGKDLALFQSAPITLELINQDVSQPVITGAILPFSLLNIGQKIVFPYTYALMYYLDFMSGHVPWWAAIMITTATARLLFFPLVVKQNIIGIKSGNVLPETQKIQKQLNDAMCSGDSYGQAIAKTKLNNLFKEHGITMKERIMPIIFQAPLYMSFFFLLRKLTNIPVEGLTTGGVLWFSDLTVPDPYYILPLLTSASMLMLLEFGLEGSANPSLMTPVGRYFMRAIPVGLFLVTYSFPAATLLFWSTSNFFTLTYALIMKTKTVKRIFKIPDRIQHDPSKLPLSSMTFKGQMKVAMDKSQARKTSLDVRRLDDIAFRKAGIGPLKKTYKDPPDAKVGA